MRLLALFLFLSMNSWAEEIPPFRLSLGAEPSSVKPWEYRSTSGSYFLSQVTGTLLTYQEQKLIGNLASSCEYFSDLKILCKIREEAKWNSGTSVFPENFKFAFVQMLKPENKGFHPELLFPIKNAKAFYLGKATVDELGISIKGRELTLELESPNREFIYNLANPLLAAIPPVELPDVEKIQKNPSLFQSAGPYVITAWDAQKKITLKNNPLYWKKINRPDVEIVYVSEDSVAVSLYESGKLDLLRRLPTAFIPKYKGRADYHELDQFRFDYLGFGPKWKSDIKFRETIAESIDYKELTQLYHAKSPVGCPGILPHLYKGEICHQFDAKKAKVSYEKLNPKPKNFELFYSKQGGEDHKRSMEWIQSQMKNNLGFEIQVMGLEEKLYVEKLKSTPPDLFRKGIAPVRPTCLAALEIFGTGHEENYIQFSSKKFDGLLKKMAKSKTEQDKKKLCSEGIHLLMDESYIIPTGVIYFTMLIRPNFTGWKLNELNQLDLSELTVK